MKCTHLFIGTATIDVYEYLYILYRPIWQLRYQNCQVYILMPEMVACSKPVVLLSI